jgi:hypothetical protein
MVSYSSIVSLLISFLLFRVCSGFGYYSIDLFRYSFCLFLFVIVLGFANPGSAGEVIGSHSAFSGMGSICDSDPQFWRSLARGSIDAPEVVVEEGGFNRFCAGADSSATERGTFRALPC